MLKCSFANASFSSSAAQAEFVCPDKLITYHCTLFPSVYCLLMSLKSMAISMRALSAYGSAMKGVSVYHWPGISVTILPRGFGRLSSLFLYI